MIKYWNFSTPCPPIDSILTLMTVWRIRGKIIRTAITLRIGSSYSFRFSVS